MSTMMKYCRLIIPVNVDDVNIRTIFDAKLGRLSNQP